MEQDDQNIDSLSFSVDAGIINRLGIELVGRSETAVSELIKNSYDADATVVDVLFENTDSIGGTLIIDDNGEGMDLNALENGFMRLSSTDKLHNPVSSKFNRTKAGKKGIGRFSTQRLGSKLTITTKRADMPKALQIVIDWNEYTIDTNLETIENQISLIDPIKEYGTQLKIEGLREAWSNVEIRRVYRYISDLLQPDFLSDRASTLNLAGEETEDNSFVVYCNRVSDGTDIEEISAPDKILFSKAVATIEGYVDNSHDGYCSITSSKLNLDGADIIGISSGNERDTIEKFKELKNIKFKAYYFIYDNKYYNFDNNFTKLELRSIQKIAEESSGIKLYRNGFRVYPYGEKGDDWLALDRTVDPIRRDSGINLPFKNKNFFGFIELIEDEENKQFEETASREGLIENKAFKELQDFVLKAFIASLRRIASAEEFIRIKEEREKWRAREREFEEIPIIHKEDHFVKIKESISELQEKIQNDSPDKEELISSFLENLPQRIDDTKDAFDEQIKENGMLRVLAGIGLVIGEFVHEIEQFDTIFKSRIKFIRKRITDALVLGKVEELEEALLTYQSYTAYFRASVSQNVKRDIAPINLKVTVNTFLKQIENNSKKANIQVQKEYLDQFLITCPMHPSEWLSILFNLYTNAKKAIKRSGNKGQILIRVSKVENNLNIEFYDNGDGISEGIREQIFTPFYTTSNPIDPDKNDIQDNSGTGLGLYIINKIISSYDGSISVMTPTIPDYVTCFKITLPSDG